MPRALNRVGVEVAAATGTAATALPAELLRAKKVERCARAKQRAEEKSRLERSKQLSVSDATPESNHSGGGDAILEPQPTAVAVKDKVHTPEVEEHVSVAVNGGACTANVLSALEQANAEHGTEEVINVDANAARLNLTVQSPEQVQQGGLNAKKKQFKRAPTDRTANAAAFKIQKALKRKFLKKTLKKCASFLRHSSRVFAKVDLPPPLTPPLDMVSPPADEDDPVTAPNSLQHSSKPSRSHSPVDSSLVEIPTQKPNRDKCDSTASPGKRKEKKTKLDSRKTHQGKRDASPSSSESHRDSSSEHDKDEAEDLSSPASILRSSRSSSSAPSSLSSSSSPSSSSSSSDKKIRQKFERSSTRNQQSKRKDVAAANKKTAMHSRRTIARESGDGTSGDSNSGSFAAVGPMPALLLGVSDKDYSQIHHDSAIKIQAWVRGVQGRRLAHIQRVELEREIANEALHEVHEEASIRIQAIAKGYLTRRQLGIAPSIKSSKNRGTTKNRRASITALFKGDDATEMCAAVSESPEKYGNDEKLYRGGRNNSEDNVAEWPVEFDLEGFDDWEELNTVSNASGDCVTHTHFLSKSKLRVFCGTWNMHAKKPQDDLRLWIPLNKYHIVAVGTEECVHSIAKSVVFTSKKQWEDLLKETLGEEYVLVSSHSLTAIHNIVFAHESVIPLLSNIQSDAVATGLGNQLGNKGGVGIAFSIGRTNFAFVNCHFDAHQQNTDKRNGNFHRINQELRLYPSQNSLVTPGSSSLPPSNAVTGLASLDGLGKTTASRFSTVSSNSPPVGLLGKKQAISECFDRVFWFGDLNYRINGTRRMVDLLLLHNKYEVLRFNDQLQIEMAKGRVFAHFQEGPLHFRPTYKFDKHSNVYDSSSKQRIPSWTDRVLYLSNEKANDIEILSYRSQMSFQTSDHRPVGATFQVNFKRQFDATENSSTEFSRVLARGYRANQAKSEVCTVQ
ncbi:Inositol polyphosphate 5-phosphatase, partial [Globisporangium splendens]